MKKRTVGVGIIGFGTVGTGTARILLEQAGLLRERLGFPLELKAIADLDVTTDRGVDTTGVRLITSAEELINDPSIDIVVELVGGYHPALEFIKEALSAGKHVVTANKALLAVHGDEIFAAAAAAGRSVGFEASVAGGIPIIKVLREGLVGNRIASIYGIINGTCNYILTEMERSPVPFETVLAEAQRLGYAEADPTFDVEGIDSAHKLAIIGTLAFGIPLAFEGLYTEGISRVEPIDMEFAREFGYKIKLLGIAKEDDRGVELRVHPTMIPETSPIAKVDGVFNAVYVDADFLGPSLYYGKGAGDLPTGSAVVADIVDIARDIVAAGSADRVPVLGRRELLDRPLVPMSEVRTGYYVRLSVADRPGVLSKISGIFGAHSISIQSVIQKGRKEGGTVPLVLLTHTAVEKDMKAALQAIQALEVVEGDPMVIRVEEEIA